MENPSWTFCQECHGVGKMKRIFKKKARLTFRKEVEQFEKNIIEQALLKTGDNKAKAAQLLEISERSLWYKIKKYF